MSKTAFLFPGQGAQKAGMGKDFYENSPLAAEIYDRASELLSLDMKALCFEENDRLDLTEYTQAALVTTCLAMERVLKEEVARDAISVVITKSPCVLLTKPAVKKYCVAEPEKCKKCGLCLKPGCPAMAKNEDGTISIDDTMCNGCGLCVSLCRHDAIKEVQE